MNHRCGISSCLATSSRSFSLENNVTSNYFNAQFYNCHSVSKAGVYEVFLWCRISLWYIVAFHCSVKEKCKLEGLRKCGIIVTKTIGEAELKSITCAATTHKTCLPLFFSLYLDRLYWKHGKEKFHILVVYVWTLWWNAHLAAWCLLGWAALGNRKLTHALTDWPQTIQYT